MSLEKILFKKIYTWVVLILVLLGFIAFIIFGSLVDYFAKGGNRFGYLKPIINQLISIPVNMIRTLNPNIHGLALDQSRFKNFQGLTLKNSKAEDGYLLLSGVSKNYKEPEVLLIDLSKNKKIFSWKFDVDKFPDFRNKQLDTFQMKHPFLFKNGDLLFKDQYGPLIRFDKCSKIKWVKKGKYHHSIEVDDDENIWTSNIIENKNFKDDSIEKISPEGKILFKKSVFEILKENYLENLIVTAKETGNPIHLNDIQPVLQDSKFWMKGDLFLSLRNLSMVLLYRPSTNKILWYQQGPWVYQHDVDIINKSNIAIFNNNMNLEKTGVNGFNNTIIYNFEKKKLLNTYRKAYEKNDIRTPEAGLSEIIKNEDIIVEETLMGRILRMNKKGEIIWQFINRSDDAKLYILSWSRYLDKKEVSNEFLKSINKSC